MSKYQFHFDIHGGLILTTAVTGESEARLTRICNRVTNVPRLKEILYEA
jgi:hypothetical protein